MRKRLRKKIERRSKIKSTFYLREIPSIVPSLKLNRLYAFPPRKLHGHFWLGLFLEEIEKLRDFKPMSEPIIISSNEDLCRAFGVPHVYKDEPAEVIVLKDPK